MRLPPGASTARPGPADLTLNLSLMIIIWSPSRRRTDRRLRRDRPPLPRLRPPQGLVLLPARWGDRRPDPGRPARPLQGDSRLPHRPRVELPQLRRALHHPPDHHRGEDGDPQQAHAAQPVRLLQPDAGGGGRSETTLDEILPGPTRPRSGQPGDRHRGAGEPRLLPLGRLRGPLRPREPRALPLPGRPLLRGVAERLECDTKTVDNALQRVKRKVGTHLGLPRGAALVDAPAQKRASRASPRSTVRQRRAPL